MNGADWLDEIHRRYGRTMVTPVYVAAEVLLGRTDPDEVARSIRSRGRSVGDEVMAATSAADVADAVEELISFGFLADVFAASSPLSDEHTEHVFGLRMP